MKKDSIIWLLPVGVFVFVVGLMFWWLGGESRGELEVRMPGFDGRDKVVESDEPVRPEGVLEDFASNTDPAPRPFGGEEIPGSWPWFRGETFNAAVSVDESLVRDWGEEGPKELWSVDLGEGYAGAAIHNSRVYVMDYDQEAKADAVRCFSLGNGEEFWRFSYPVKIKRNHGMSRTVPAVTDDYVVALGPKCHLTCLDAKTGEFKWMYNLEREFGTKIPLWYAGQCPFIVDGKVIVAPAGTDVLMMAVDCETGEIVWKTPNPNGWEMTHSSILPMNFGGRDMYVYCSSGGVTGVGVEDGKVLWETNEWKLRTNVPSPVAAGDGLIFLSAGYGKGSKMLKLSEAGGAINVETVFTHKPKQFGSEQQTPVFYEGHIYGMRADWQMVCMNPAGETVWESSSQHTFEKLGPYMIADGLLYIMDGSGTLTIAEATSEGYKELGQAKVLDGIESWAPMALAGGRMVVRDLKRMVCVEVGQ